MPNYDRRRSGFRYSGPVNFLSGAGFTRTAEEKDVTSATEASWAGFGMDKSARIQEDFLQSSSGTLPAPWAVSDTSAAGSPTLDYIDDADNGEYTLAFDSQDEAQSLVLYFGDSLHIDATKRPFIEWRVKIDADTALSADDRVVVGIAAAHNATLDSNAGHAWFRMEATQDILIESDDGTTDTDDTDSTVDWVDDTYVTLAIDLANLAAVAFYVDGALVGTTDCSDLTGSLQPYAAVQKDAGAVTHALVVDYCSVAWMR